MEASFRITSESVKEQAKVLQKYLNNPAIERMSLASCYQALALIYGYESWNELSTLLKKNS